jgi:serine/threonine protein kinase
MRPLGAGARLVDGIEVIGHLARSDVLDVYDAWCARRGCRVAVKVLRPDRRGDRRARAALLREGRLLARLSHPHLVRAYEVHAAPRPAVVLETLRGATLAALTERRRLSAREAAHLGLQVGSALHHLHGNGLLHLDVKPSNVIADGGAARLIDLSIARRPGRVRPGLGTWCYLAPEQARGEVVGPAADVWGLALLLHEGVTGEPAFGDDDAAEYPCLERPPAPLRHVRPRRMAAVLEAALRPEAAARPALPELLAVLDEVAGAPAGAGRWSGAHRHRGRAPVARTACIEGRARTAGGEHFAARRRSRCAEAANRDAGAPFRCSRWGDPPANSKLRTSGRRIAHT